MEFRKAIGIGLIRRFDKIMKSEMTDNDIANLRKKKIAELDKKESDKAIALKKKLFMSRQTLDGAIISFIQKKVRAKGKEDDMS